jgi:hypothetical protein
MPSPNLVRAARKIEELPTDDGSVLDTIAGAILRIFVRINQLEVEHARLTSRLKALESPAAESRPLTDGDAQVNRGYVSG